MDICNGMGATNIILDTIAHLSRTQDYREKEMGDGTKANGLVPRSRYNSHNQSRQCCFQINIWPALINADVKLLYSKPSLNTLIESQM